jgi:hypothetical protein
VKTDLTNLQSALRQKEEDSRAFVRGYKFAVDELERRDEWGLIDRYVLRTILEEMRAEPNLANAESRAKAARIARLQPSKPTPAAKPRSLRERFEAAAADRVRRAANERDSTAS